ncbi:hypothetical protein F66182_3515 [Fusarium sp. NRRL 66182]|nr:hypothetical protein F66182_3515 [Fusarium sp. NRRL 66182]
MASSRGCSSSLPWLQGLRGIGALLVYFHHHQLFPRDNSDVAVLERAFGYMAKYEPVTLPFLRLFFSGGHFAVAVFFVASGYALSATPLRLVQAARYEELGEVISSSLFRRWLRLFAPVFITTLAFILIQHAVAAVWPSLGPSELSLYDNLGRFLQQLREFTFIFSRNTGPSGYTASFDYNLHLWTIQVEYAGSLIVYVSIMALSRLSTVARISWEIGFIFYFLYVVDGWYGAMFMAGMLLCDIHLLTSADTSRQKPSRNSGWMAKSGRWMVLLIGLYLGGVPHVPSTRLLARNPGWSLLSNLKPDGMADPKWIYLFLSASLVVGVVPHIPTLERALEGRLCQELGRISYGLYLVHGPVMWTMGAKLYSSTGCCRTEQSQDTAHKPVLGLEAEFILPHVILMPLTFVLAKLVADYVDAPSIRLGKWLYMSSLRRHTDNDF